MTVEEVFTYIAAHWQMIFILFFRPVSLIVKYLKSISDNLVTLEKRIIVVETRIEDAIKKGNN